MLPLKDFPFPHDLTSYCKKFSSTFNECPLSGFCSGDVIGKDSSSKIFFKAGHDLETCKMIQSEYNILVQLQDYDFIPKIFCLKSIDRYLILFMENLDAVSLDNISKKDEQFELGIRGALTLLHKLYIEKGFLHRDMHPNNIMIDSNNKVYIIDFSYSYLSSESNPVKFWGNELITLFESLELDDQLIIDRFAIFEDKLNDISDTASTDPNLYHEMIIEINNILFT